MDKPRDYHNEIKAERDALRAEVERLTQVLSNIGCIGPDGKPFTASVIKDLREQVEALKQHVENTDAACTRYAVEVERLTCELSCRDALIDDHLWKIMHLENRIEEERAEVERLTRERDEALRDYLNVKAWWNTERDNARKYAGQIVGLRAEIEETEARAEAAERKLAMAVEVMKEASRDLPNGYQSREAIYAALVELEKVDDE